MLKKFVCLFFILLLVTSVVNYAFAPIVADLRLRTPRDYAEIPVVSSLTIVTDNLKDVGFLAGQRVELTVTIQVPNVISRTSKRTLFLK